MPKAYTVDEIRAAEAPLLRAQTMPDELMKSAAHGVFLAAEAMLKWEHPLRRNDADDLPAAPDVLLLVGKGGNGGDALYAGAELAMAGYSVDGWIAWDTAHDPALEAFRNAGGTVLDEPPFTRHDADIIPLRFYRLAIDGLTGLGGGGSLGEDVGVVLEGLRRSWAYMLSVDVPSGIAADTGVKGEVHVVADATVTFGGWRYAHALAPECGIQLLADPSTGQGTIGDNLPWSEDAPYVTRAVVDDHEWPKGLRLMEPDNEEPAEPGPYDDKYTGGVVGIRAGSTTYPGAAILATAGAIHATPSMVRYAGPQDKEVVRAHPEVVATPQLKHAGRVQAWVFGPGAGTDNKAWNDLAELLTRPEPLLIDADGLTLIAESTKLVNALRSRKGQTILTPHDGEFDRLITSEWIAPSVRPDAQDADKVGRLEQTKTLAEALNCTIVRKGRSTIIVDTHHHESHVIDCGTSWAATPGSGDVLAGVMGARMARWVARFGNDAVLDLAPSVAIHSVAAALAAETPYGPAQTHASAIARAIPAATAKLARLRSLPVGVRCGRDREGTESG